MAGGWRLLAADFAMSFMWVWSSVLNKILVHQILGYGAHELDGQIIRYTVSIINMFFFAFLAKATKGGAYNPLSILSAAFSGDFSNFLFTLGARVPTQVVGAIYGVRLILDTFPGIGRGPRLNVDIAKGALTEGLLTFSIVFISLGLARKVKDSFFMKTWISSVSKLTLHILGSDLTGGCMNPASVMGWAFANGEHITKEHLVVYWLAPVQGTFAAVWVFGILTRAKNNETVAATKDHTTKLKSEN
ncbi:small and basic intrinsic protein 2 [Perilla frutescens var. hirtella]|uniref:Small and basic intrinsic protein 2 n=1 Tax=Perilla frutescens var. hirtella TaxID=608512 RepID=A0AAD4J7R8_PERFH|nr:small and basic intrinsic protein 2 [Perilla frutescens var. frutescens]KAH6828652.1 small and basic intrinsic protein 2 [Perilla frutescens var. hirtella]